MNLPVNVTRLASGEGLQERSKGIVLHLGQELGRGVHELALVGDADGVQIDGLVLLESRHAKVGELENPTKKKKKSTRSEAISLVGIGDAHAG
jgi:hypothetical protein